MTTPTHILINIGILTKKHDTLKYYILAAVAGILPDISMFFFYITEKFINKVPETILWNEYYFQEDWQLWFNIPHSIPLALLIVGIAYICKKFSVYREILIVGLGLLFHDIGDLLLHYDDGHAHFLPFSDYKLVSPISYWDPKRGSIPTTIIIILLLLTCIYWIVNNRLTTRKGKKWFLSIGLLIVVLEILGIGMTAYFMIYHGGF